MTQTQQILAALEAGPATGADLCERTGIAPNFVWTVLSNLIQDRRIIRSGVVRGRRGRNLTLWALPSSLDCRLVSAWPVKGRGWEGAQEHV